MWNIYWLGSATLLGGVKQNLNMTDVTKEMWRILNAGGEITSIIHVDDDV